MSPDHFTDNPQAAADYERRRALHEVDYDEPYVPDPSDWREWQHDERP